MEKQMNLSQIELSRYGDGSINPKVFERVWTLRRYLEVPDKMDYRDFVWFILAEEDKTDPTSIEYWFYILDQVLMKMALAELVTFNQIPVKVTLNEYIELAKQYSTRRSGQFVNGILDKLQQEMTEAGEIRKIGRGLL